MAAPQEYRVSLDNLTGAVGRIKPRITRITQIKFHVVDAIFYVNRMGVQWRYLPHDFPRWDVVHSYFRKWDNDGTWDRMQRRLRCYAD